MITAGIELYSWEKSVVDTSKGWLFFTLFIGGVALVHIFYQSTHFIFTIQRLLIVLLTGYLRWE